MNLDQAPAQVALTVSRFNVDIGSAISCTQEISAFTLLLWDAALISGREYKWIWKLSCPRTMKWIYLLSRYFPLLVQLVNVVFVWSYMSKAPLPVPSNICRDYFSFQVITFKCALFLFDVSLVMKIYASFNEDPRVGCWLFGSMVASILVSFYCGPRIRDGLEFDSTCVPYSMPMVPFLVVIISCMVRYGGKGYFALLKTRSLVRFRRSQLPWIGSLRAIDSPSFSALIGAFGVVFAMFPYANTPSPNYQFSRHSIFLWPVTVVSILSTRLILSMREGTRASIHQIEGDEP